MQSQNNVAQAIPILIKIKIKNLKCQPLFRRMEIGIRLHFVYEEKKTSGAILSFLCNQKMMDKIMHRKRKKKEKEKPRFARLI